MKALNRFRLRAFLIGTILRVGDSNFTIEVIFETKGKLLIKAFCRCSRRERPGGIVAWTLLNSVHLTTILKPILC